MSLCKGIMIDTSMNIGKTELNACHNYCKINFLRNTFVLDGCKSASVLGPNKSKICKQSN